MSIQIQMNIIFPKFGNQQIIHYRQMLRVPMHWLVYQYSSWHAKIDILFQIDSNILGIPTLSFDLTRNASLISGGVLNFSEPLFSYEVAWEMECRGWDEAETSQSILGRPPRLTLHWWQTHGAAKAGLGKATSGGGHGGWKTAHNRKRDPEKAGLRQTVLVNEAGMLCIPLL